MPERVPPPRESRINLRLDRELYVAAIKKARVHGGISAVIRAMLRKFVRGEVNFDLEDLANENTPAERPGRPPARQKARD